MRIFVTGMTGFLGHELGQILLKKGHREEEQKEDLQKRMIT